MTAVLLESVGMKVSPWVRISPHSTGIRVQGMQADDIIKLEFQGPNPIDMLVHEDSVVEIPEGSQRIRAIHTGSSGSPVSVDIENGSSCT